MIQLSAQNYGRKRHSFKLKTISYFCQDCYSPRNWCCAIHCYTYLWILPTILSDAKSLTSESISSAANLLSLEHLAEISMRICRRRFFPPCSVKVAQINPMFFWGETDLLLIHLNSSWLAIVATAAGLLIIFESLGHFPFLLEVFRRTVNHQLPITWQIAYTTSPKTGDTTPAAGISHQSQITMGY